MVMVNPQPIAFAMGKTNADAAAANKYRTPVISYFCKGHAQLFTAMTSAERSCIESTAYVLSGARVNIRPAPWITMKTTGGATPPLRVWMSQPYATGLSVRAVRSGTEAETYSS